MAVLTLEQLQKTWGKFVDESFPLADPGGQLNKLQDEMAEFLEEPSVEEAADIIIVLLSWAHRADVDLDAAVWKKISKNLNRTWEFDPERRVYKHV